MLKVCFAAQENSAADPAAILRGLSVMLRGSLDEMAEELRRRRDAFGTSYISVNQAFYEELAPVVEKLTGT